MAIDYCLVLTEKQADSLLLATLSYNVGYGNLMDNPTHCKSKLLRMLDCGYRKIRSECIAVCLILIFCSFIRTITFYAVECVFLRNANIINSSEL